jgi:hypothetical protein
MEVTMGILARAFTLGIVLILSHASALSADPVLITDSRRVVALALIGSNFPSPDLQTPSAPFAPFDEQVSASVVDGLTSAHTVTSQQSSFAPRLWSASGMVDSSATGAGESFDPGFTAGSSLFDLEFDLAAPHRFSLTGFMAVDRLEESPGSGGFGEVDFSLVTQSLSGDITVAGDGIRFGSRQLNVSGNLSEGRHRFFVEAFTESISAGQLTRHTPSFDLEFALTPIPEPGSWLLLGGGLLMLASKRLTAGVNFTASSE